MNLSIIAAVAEDNAIGKDNDLLVYLSEDLKRFKKLTTEHGIIMGRKTYESLPNGALPNRKNIILTRDKDYKAKDCIIVQSVKEALQQEENGQGLFVIGGASVYQLFMEYAGRLYITQIHKSFPEADTFFPEISDKDWSIESQGEMMTDLKTGVQYSFVNYIRCRV